MVLMAISLKQLLLAPGRILQLSFSPWYDGINIADAIVPHQKDYLLKFSMTFRHREDYRAIVL
jgi:hypothetical protein